MAKKHKRLRVIPSHLPLIRDKLAQFNRQDTMNSIRRWHEDPQYRAAADMAWERDQADKGTAGNYLDLLEGNLREIDDYATAQLWWISRDMVRLAADTALTGDFPHEPAPSTHGFMFFEDGLTIEERSGRTVHLAGLIWQLDANREWTVSPLSDEPEILESTGAAQAGLPVGIGWLANPDGTINPDPQRYLTGFVHAVWTLSQQPRITTVKPASPDPKHPMPEHVNHEIRKVKMLVLRENLHRPGTTGDDEKTRRELSHRFIVRGFWRDQAYGPNHSLRRRQWIPPYVKGPADKPLITKETIRIWRR